MSNMNRLDPARRTQVLKALAEGMSLRGAARLTGVARMTIEKLVRDLGAACARYQDEHLRDLTCQRIQCDEIWSFCYAKRKNVTDKIKEQHPDAGDVWTWTAIDADTKLCVSWMIGGRDAGYAHEFIADLASRLRHRVQLTTDQHHAYLAAIEDNFAEVDYAQLHKIYAAPSEDASRYSPAACIGTRVKVRRGDPDPKHISTSYVERANLTMRMHMRRFTRLTNAFSKKAEMHAHAVAIHFMWYNFVRIHQTLRITPAMAAGVTDRVWDAEDIIRLLES
jgi:IS1 family transposase